MCPHCLGNKEVFKHHTLRWGMLKTWVRMFLSRNRFWVNCSRTWGWRSVQHFCCEERFKQQLWCEEEFEVWDKQPLSCLFGTRDRRWSWDNRLRDRQAAKIGGEVWRMGLGKVGYEKWWCRWKNGLGERRPVKIGGQIGRTDLGTGGCGVQVFGQCAVLWC